MGVGGQHRLCVASKLGNLASASRTPPRAKTPERTKIVGKRAAKLTKTKPANIVVKQLWGVGGNTAYVLFLTLTEFSAWWSY